MSHIFGTEVNFNSNEAKNFRIENSLSFPTVGVSDSGRIVLNTGLNGFYGWNGTSWVNFAGGGSYTLPTATTSVLGGVKIDGTTITIDGTGTISAGAGSTGLEAINEGNGNGYRLIGMSADNYGPIGFGSIDFSQNDASTTFGARGLYGLNYGTNNTQGIGFYYQFTAGDSNVTSNHYTIAWGQGNSASNYCSMAFGYQNTVPSPYSMAFGVYNNVQDYYAGAVGLGLDVQSPCGFHVGIGNTIYTNTALNQANGRMFVVGNGVMVAGAPNTVGARSDAMIVYWDGRIIAPDETIALIDAESTGKILTTKEWTDAKYLPKYLVNATVTGTYNIDWNYDTLRLTMTGATVFSDINLPTSGVNTKTLTIYMDGNFTPTWPAGWTTYVTGTYDGTVLNQIVVEFISTGVYWVDINRAD